MNRIIIKEDKIYNINASKDIILLHIADIHFSASTTKKRMNKIKKKILEINPDYLVITGDLIDRPSICKNKIKIKELINFLTDISYKIKVFISLGNHDIINNRDMIFFNKINDLYNIQVLNNKLYQDEQLCIGGLTLPSNYYYNVNKCESKEILLEELEQNKNLFNKLPKTLPKILLVHSPLVIFNDDVIDKIYKYDIVLSGHTHNGMMPYIMDKAIKGNRGIISPGKKLFPDMVRGKVEKYAKGNKMTLIINGGITKLSEKSGKILSKLNFVYDIHINKIIISKKRG